MDSINKSPIFRLVTRFVRWVRTIGHTPEPTPPGERVASTPDCSLWEIRDTDEPGVKLAYWVVHRDASRDLAIALINIAHLREDLGRRNFRPSTDPLRLTSGAKFRATLNQYLKSEEGLELAMVTHILVVCWQSRLPNEHKHYRVDPVAAIPCDLVGAGIGWGAGDRYAKAITKAMAHQLLRLQTRRDESWEFFVSQIEWVGWLEDYARHQFGPNHILQPRRTPAP